MGFFKEEELLKGMIDCHVCKGNYYEFEKHFDNRVNITCLGCGYKTKKYWQSIYAIKEANERAKNGSGETTKSEEY
jgi:hypothetical protein